MRHYHGKGGKCSSACSRHTARIAPGSPLWVKALEANVFELNGLMRLGDVRVVEETTAAMAYQMAVPA